MLASLMQGTCKGQLISVVDPATVFDKVSFMRRGLRFGLHDVNAQR
jgi:hypothetical protein